MSATASHASRAVMPGSSGKCNNKALVGNGGFHKLDTSFRLSLRDLLAALEAIIEHGDWDAATCSRCQTITTQARAAIDAAKGETK